VQPRFNAAMGFGLILHAQLLSGLLLSSFLFFSLIPPSLICLSMSSILGRLCGTLITCCCTYVSMLRIRNTSFQVKTLEKTLYG
jgi:hypothetical protein